MPAASSRVESAATSDRRGCPLTRVDFTEPDTPVTGTNSPEWILHREVEVCSAGALDDEPGRPRSRRLVGTGCALGRPVTDRCVYLTPFVAQEPLTVRGVGRPRQKCSPLPRADVDEVCRPPRSCPRRARRRSPCLPRSRRAVSVSISVRLSAGAGRSTLVQQ